LKDEESVRSSLSRMLKGRGIEAIVVATANDALARIARQEIRPDLLICDYNLRGSATALTRSMPCARRLLEHPGHCHDGRHPLGRSWTRLRAWHCCLIKPFRATNCCSTIATASPVGFRSRQSEAGSFASAKQKTRQVAPPRSKSHQPSETSIPRRPASCRRSSSAWRTRRRR
jgi:DNA-binding NtrC family response regulator